jgi:hypothetical protein
MGTWSPGRIRIVWPEGHPQYGLEVVMRRQQLGEVINSLVDPPRTREELERMTPKEVAEWSIARSERNLKDFAELVVSWNFDPYDTGEPIPVTVESVKLLDQATYDAIDEAYTAAVRRVAPPLPQPSPDGEPSGEELTLPQEPL